MQMPQCEEACDNRGTLKDHLQLAGHLGRKIAALLFDETADGRDEHFASDDDNGHPRHNAAAGFSREIDERAADDDLINERVEDSAELCHLVILAGPPAVDPI